MCNQWPREGWQVPLAQESTFLPLSIRSILGCAACLKPQLLDKARPKV